MNIGRENELLHVLSARNKWPYAVWESVFCMCTYNFLIICAFVLNKFTYHKLYSEELSLI